MDYLEVLEAGSLSLDRSEAVRKGPSQASLSFWWLWAAVSSWLVEASPPSLPTRSHGVLSVCMSLSKSPLLVRTLVVLDEGLPLITSLKAQSPNNSLSKALTGLGLQRRNLGWGDTIQPMLLYLF